MFLTQNILFSTITPMVTQSPKSLKDSPATENIHKQSLTFDEACWSLVGRLQALMNAEHPGSNNAVTEAVRFGLHLCEPALAAREKAAGLS